MSSIKLEPNADDRQIETTTSSPATAAQEEWRSQQEAKALKRAERLGVPYVPWTPPVAKPEPLIEDPGPHADRHEAFAQREGTLHLTTTELAVEIASGRMPMPNRPSSLCKDGWLAHEGWQATR